jgi:hypothetical protein
MFYIDDRSIMGSFLSTPSHATVAFEIGGNFKPDENSVLIVAVPDTKSNFNCNQSRFCKITPEICKSKCSFEVSKTISLLLFYYICWKKIFRFLKRA